MKRKAINNLNVVIYLLFCLIIVVILGNFIFNTKTTVNKQAGDITDKVKEITPTNKCRFECINLLKENNGETGGVCQSQGIECKKVLSARTPKEDDKTTEEEE